MAFSQTLRTAFAPISNAWSGLKSILYRFLVPPFLKRKYENFQLTPMNKRRWTIFRNNKRGFYSLIIFMILFILSLFAEFIANDKPYLIKYDGGYYSPVLFSYAETDFGGEFESEADYRDPVLECLIRTNGSDSCEEDANSTETKNGSSAGWMAWPPIRYSYDTINLNLPVPAPAPPSSENLLGTDDQGRDVVARMIYGFRISILFGLILTIVSSIIGVVAGAIQGYYGGWIDLIAQRFIEIWTSVPQLYLLIIIASIITPGFWTLLFILMLFSWVALVGVVRAEFLRGRNLEYVTAARAMGLTHRQIIFRHLLPNAMVATLTFMPFILNGSITSLTALDYLGYGLPPGSPSLGEMLAQGKSNINAPWLGFTAFFTISIMLSLLVFVGEAVRDALDPRKSFH